MSHATAAAVRAFAAEKGIAVGPRGRFSDELVAAFNEGRPAFNRYVPGKAPVHTVTVKGRNAKGKLVEKKVSPAEARVALAAQGVAVKSRGRLPKALLAQAAGLTVDVPTPGAVKARRAKHAEARAALLAAGHEVGSRGALSEANLALAASL